MEIIKKIIRRIRRIKGGLFEFDFYKPSYSQEGEDMILNRIFEGKQNGFFIDVGAHHPFRFSNTYHFYKLGWRGINIDPLPTSKLLFEKYRPNDINFNIGVSCSEEPLNYYMFNEPALNTFSEEEAKIRNGENNGTYFIIEEKIIPTKKLSTILNETFQRPIEIDFISIDVEGMDLEVLQSNDWEKYKPKVVLIEELRSDLSKIISESAIRDFLQSKGYSLYCRTCNTSFYIYNV